MGCFNKRMAEVVVLLASVPTFFATGCATPPSSYESTAAARPDFIEAQLQSQRRYFENCVQAHRDEKLDGMLVVHFRVRTDGSTALPHIFEQIGQSNALDQCLMEAASHLKFTPLPSGMIAEVEYPVSFTANRHPALSNFSAAKKGPRSFETKPGTSSSSLTKPLPSPRLSP